MNAEPMETKTKNTTPFLNRDVIVRTRSAGVFAGCLVSLDCSKQVSTAVVKNARRLWYWKSACSLSQLSVDGVTNPEECKFPVEVPEVLLLEVIEVLPLSEKARATIDSVKVWTTLHGGGDV